MSRQNAELLGWAIFIACWGTALLLAWSSR